MYSRKVTALAIVSFTALTVSLLESKALAQPLLNVQVLDVNCPFSGVSFSNNFTKVLDIGTFAASGAPDSIVEITFNGRLFVGSFDASSTGAVFELRVDDMATAAGRGCWSSDHAVIKEYGTGPVVAQRSQ